MDFNGLKCPACNTPFEEGDDIVVCPECGTPHHRQCYEEDGHCYFENRHKDNFSFDEYIKEETGNDETPKGDNPAEEIKRCPNCGAENPAAAMYCRNCNTPLFENKQNSYGQYNPNGGNTQAPEGMPFFQVMYDPMAGHDPTEEMLEGVTAGELAKYTQKNTNYFMRVFGNIRDFNKSKFNFSAFLFTGAYMLYRKMYKLGTVFTCIVGLLIVLPILIETLPVFGWQEIFQEASAGASTSDYMSFYNDFAANLSALDFSKQFIFYLPSVLSIIKWVFMIVAGIIANKSYFKDAVGKVKKIKEAAGEDAGEVNQKIQSAGGVNTVAAVVALVCYLIINYASVLF